MKIDNPPQQWTPEQIAEEEAKIKIVRERMLAARAKEEAKKKIDEAETYAFDDQRVAGPDKKALDREKQIEALRQEIAGM